MVELNLKHIYKHYDNAEDGQYSVTDFNLDIKDREFIVFVGPSGCGKSTTLRMIAGLEDISKGEFLIDGRVVNDEAPKDRDIAMVFQNYALYPHMTVYDNMAFGLKLRKYDKEDIDKRVHHAAKILGLEEYLQRKPAALSGGQRQRVALGRAIVRDAPIFLMDEPLSNLDAKLRVSMRAEIAKLHQQLKTTTIYVTQEVYDHPANVFVGGFIGSPAMNFFKVTLKDGKITDDGNNFTLSVPEGCLKVLKDKGYDGKEIVFGIRPEDIHSEPAFLKTFPESVVNAEVVVSELLGADSQLYSRVGNTEFVSKVDARDYLAPGSKVQMGFDINKAHFFDKDSELSVY